jgi:hypothetical protein
MTQQAPMHIEPDAKWFVIRSPDNQGGIVGKFETNARVHIPEEVGDFVVVELPDKQSLDNYAYDYEKGFQTP